MIDIYKLARLNLLLSRKSFKFGLRKAFVRKNLCTFVSGPIFKNFQKNLGLNTSRFSSGTQFNFKKSITNLSLFVASAFIVGTIILGGITRRQKAGLAMTTWNFLPEHYPTTEDEWKVEFDRYKEIPEYYLSDQTMTMDEFKELYNLEFLHRYAGRITGFVVLATSLILSLGSKSDKIRGLVYSLLVILQGLLGWYMVKSGFDEKTLNSVQNPTVSPYRLCAHNVLACLLLSLTLHRYFSGIMVKEVIEKTPLFKVASMTCHVALLLCLTTIAYGSLASGTHAILVHKTHGQSSHEEPAIEEKWSLEPTYRNLFEDQHTVLKVHMGLGRATMAVVPLIPLMVLKIFSLRQPKLLVGSGLAAVSVVAQVIIAVLHLNVTEEWTRLTHQGLSLQTLALLIYTAAKMKFLKG